MELVSELANNTELSVKELRALSRDTFRNVMRKKLWQTKFDNRIAARIANSRLALTAT